MSNVDCDVLIAGGGPAGLSTWLHLRALAPELAARTILLEKEIYPRDKLCGGGVTPLADAMLRSLGIRVECTEVPIHCIEFRFGKERVRLEKRNAFRVVRRREYDHALARAAIERGLDVRQGEGIAGFVRDDGRLVIETSRARIAARVLVGADGAHSVVRHAIDTAGDARLARVIEVLTPADAEMDPEFAEHTAVFDFSPVAEGLQGYVWHFPCIESGAASMNRGICDTRIHPQRERADLRAIFARELEARRVVRPPSTWDGHPVRCFATGDVFSAAGVILAGDAAGIDPAPGEGIAQSIDYGDVAARAIVDAFARADLSFADYRTRLLRHPLGRSLMTRARLARRLYGRAGVDLERLRALWLKSLPPM